MNTPCETSDILIFSHLRWDQGLQRPHHLLSRYAKYRRVFFIEAPTIGKTMSAHLHSKVTHEGINVIIPYLPMGLDKESMPQAMGHLLTDFTTKENISDFTALYYSSRAINYTRHLVPALTLFDYKDAGSTSTDEELLNKAHLVFTCGQSLFESFNRSAKKNIFSYSCCVDYDHFYQGRRSLPEPEDQKNIPYPRIGFYGDLDEKFNYSLLEKMAELRPEFQFVILADPNKMKQAQRENIHYLGPKDYYSLPKYLSSWDCAFLPYKLNEETQFFSPPLIPELLATAKPIVSTSLHDSVHPYVDSKLIYVADHPEHFVQSIEKAINESTYDPEWLERVDQYLEGVSWDSTFEQMALLEIRMKKMLQNIRAPAYEDTCLMSIGIV